MTPSGWGWEAEIGIVDSWKKDTGQTIQTFLSRLVTRAREIFMEARCHLVPLVTSSTL
jgi:hypothetical protein